MKKRDPMTFRGIRYYPAGDGERTYLYWTERPTPKRNSQGRPSLEVFDVGSSVRISLETRWGPVGDDLEALRKRLAEDADVSPAEVQMSPAPFVVDEAVLDLVSGDGSRETVATSSTSGVPPYGALFQVSLAGDEKEAAMEALSGGRPRLVVRYEATFRPEVSATAEISGDRGDVHPRVDPGDRLEEVRTAVEDAIADGRLHIDVSSDGPAELEHQVRAMALDLYAERLLDRTRARRSDIEGEDVLSVGVSLSTQDGIPVRAESSLADWFEDLPPEGHVHAAGSR